MKTLLTTFMACMVLLAFGQSSVQPARLIEAAKAGGKGFESMAFFSLADSKPNLGKEEPGEYDILELDQDALQKLRQEQPSRLIVSLPSENKPVVEIELVQVDLFADGFSVIESSTMAPAEVDLGLHYRGVIKGSRSSIAAVSFFEEGIMGFFSADEMGNYVIGELEGPRSTGQYIYYRDQDVLEELAFDCGTPDEGPGYTKEDLAPLPATRGLDDCVGMYFEVDYDIYQDKGGTQGATNYVTGIFNEVATLYANESINTEISELLVWNTTSPYSSSSSSGMLSDFQASTGSFNGDLAHLLSYQASGGIAAGFSGLCNSNPDNSKCFSSIGSTYEQVPTYSFTIMVVTHEFGHLFGSRHTHACVWNGNNTAIDGCAGSTEGSCPLPGYPSDGGTIMSYCHIQSVGINFNKGFGTQPGNVVRNRVSNASCLQACGGGGGGGSSCNDNEVTLSITLDNYPGETTWDIKNSSGSTVASGGPYSGQSGTVTTNICLVDGCYDFTIYDSYGDGICCSYGSGSYSLTDGSTVLASGGSFGSSETTSFCVGSAPPPPSYCGSQGNNSNYEWIQRIKFGSIDNNSGNNGGYADFTNLSTGLTPGGSVSVTLYPGFSGSSYTEYWRLWIDYNQDGDFTDSGEQIGQGSGTGTLSGTLNISSSALSGTTRLRIAMKYNAYPTSCESFSYGEVEDYSVVIGSNLPGAGIVQGGTGLSPEGVTAAAARPQVSVYPNPTKGELNLDYYSERGGQVQIEVLSLMGQRLQRLDTDAYSGDNTFRLDIGKLPEGAYLVRLRAGEQQHVERVTITR